MANSFYVHGSYPTTSAPGASASMRAELELITAGFDKFPALTTGANKALLVNGAGTAVTLTTGTLALAGNFSTTGAFALSFTVTAGTTVTLPTSGTLATLAGVETLTNKTLVTPALGTPLSGVATNLTGTAAGLTAGNVTTNANLTGDVTSVGNAATVVKLNGTSLAGLATGLLKNTTATGGPSIAVNADLPAMSATVGGAVPTPPNNTTTFLRGDGTFAVPANIAPSGNFTVTQNAVVPFTSINAGAVANTLVLSAGNVGIGATLPGAKLEVSKLLYGTTLGASRALILNGTQGATGDRTEIGMGYTGTNSPIVLGIVNTNSTNYTIGDFYIATRALTTDVAPLERLRVTTAGNVGIGTTNPNYTLEIATDSAGKPGVGGLWTVVSDERIKTGIVPADLDRCYTIVKSVPLKHFGFAPGVYTDEQIHDKNNLGWIAQDVQKVFKHAVTVKPFTLKTDIPDGTEDYEEQDFTLEIVEETKTSIEVITGKPVQVSKIVTSERKVPLFDIVDVRDEAGNLVMEHYEVSPAVGEVSAVMGTRPVTYQMPRMVTKTRPKVRHEVIADCLDLNGGQMIAALYGAVQALMAQVEAQAARITRLETPPL